MPQLTKVTFILIACIGALHGGVDPDWTAFNSSTGFRVMYPASWYRITVSSKNRLDILSSKGGAEAIVIKRGQARVTVIELTGSPFPSLSQIIDDDAKEAVAIVSRSDINNEDARKDSCNVLRKVVSKHEAVPAADVPIRVPYIIDTDFYCEINGRKFTTRLRNWDGDAQQEAYQRIALQIARTLRLTF